MSLLDHMTNPASKHSTGKNVCINHNALIEHPAYVAVIAF